MASDLTKLQHAGAAYVPAVQMWYSRFVGAGDHTPIRVPGLLMSDLDFLNPNSQLFNIKTVLISAFDGLKSNKRECMVEERDRSNTTVIADSGGFSLISASLEASSITALEMLTYQEEYGDWCMTLDVPTEAIDKGKTYTTFRACLDQTLKYLDVYRDNRRSTKVKGFLNVLQGRSRDECNAWYQAVKDYPFEGWAFAGKLRLGFGLVLERLIQMRDEKKLDDRKWLHFLGTGRPDVAVILTAIQDGLRASGCPDITVSFDNSSTSSIVSRNKKGHASAVLNQTDFKLNMARLPDHIDYFGSNKPFPFLDSPIGQRLRMGDICFQPRRGRTKSGNHSVATWDQLSILLLSNHCTYIGCRSAAEAACRTQLFKEEAYHIAPSYLIDDRHFIIDILASETPGKLLKLHSKALNAYARVGEDRFKPGWTPPSRAK